jgi:hypothetical protein
MATDDTSAPEICRYQLIPYGRHHANSGVIAYATGPDYIAVQFNSGETYLYTEAETGRAHIDAMQRCAETGTGLSGYIARHPQIRYDRTLHPVGRLLVEG